MEKIYQLYGIDTAMHLLRPGATWEISNMGFSKWDDPRPCPTMEEVKECMEKLKKLEDSIDTQWREDQLKQFGIQEKELSEQLK